MWWMWLVMERLSVMGVDIKVVGIDIVWGMVLKWWVWLWFGVGVLKQWVWIWLGAEAFEWWV